MKSRVTARWALLLLFVVSVCGAACSDLPRDPKETLKRVESGHVLRVGLVENPPWVIRTGGEPAGAEVELVRQLCKQLGARPEWHWGSEQRHMEALEHYELDLVVGGITDKTAWSKYVGITSPFYEERFIVGAPPSMTQPESLKGLNVAAKAGEMTTSYLERKGARVVPVEDVTSVKDSAVAAPSWQLEQMGFRATRFELYSEKHVWATPPGENAWIKWLDEFLSPERTQVASLLKEEQKKQ